MNVFIFSNVKNLSNKREENQRKVYFSFSFFMRAGLVPNESQPRHKRERSSFFMTIYPIPKKIRSTLCRYCGLKI